MALSSAAKSLEGTKNQAEVPDLIGRTTTGSWWVTSNANPAVRDQIAKSIGFWLQVGMAGFRVDVRRLMYQTLI